MDNVSLSMPRRIVRLDLPDGGRFGRAMRRMKVRQSCGAEPGTKAGTKMRALSGLVRRASFERQSLRAPRHRALRKTPVSPCRARPSRSLLEGDRSSPLPHRVVILTARQRRRRSCHLHAAAAQPHLNQQPSNQSNQATNKCRAALTCTTTLIPSTLHKLITWTEKGRGETS